MPRPPRGHRQEWELRRTAWRIARFTLAARSAAFILGHDPQPDQDDLLVALEMAGLSDPRDRREAAKKYDIIVSREGRIGVPRMATTRSYDPLTEIAKAERAQRPVIHGRRQSIPVAIQRAVLERDEGYCGICRGPIADKAFPHPLSPSLDHIVPWSMGGEDTVANLRLAHLRCNISRGARSAA